MTRRTYQQKPFISAAAAKEAVKRGKMLVPDMHGNAVAPNCVTFEFTSKGRYQWHARHITREAAYAAKIERCGGKLIQCHYVNRLEA